MYSKHLESLIAAEDDLVYEAYWKFSQSNINILLVIDKKQKFLGVCTLADFKKCTYLSTDEMKSMRIKDICNFSPKICKSGDMVYQQASYIFSIYEYIQTLPVVDEEGNLIDICTQNQVYYNKLYKSKSLPRMYYAECIYKAAELAKKLGYDRISIIEFGVAGGNGLVNCEFHAKEIERLLNVKIDVFGFDTGEGLPNNSDYRNMPFTWFDGCYNMDKVRLQNRLTRSKLILGDLEHTSKTFFTEFSPAPIGAMLVDVDYYTSCLPILDMLKEDDRFFLPRTFMYFDDIGPNNECIGENLAIKEFNESNEFLKISPEGRHKLKMCHRFKHKDYATRIRDLSSAQFHLNFD